MHQHHALQPHVSHAEVCILAGLISEPHTAAACYEGVLEATGQVIEPGAFSRMLVRLERRGWIEASRAEYPLQLYQITEEGRRSLERAAMQQHEEQRNARGYPDWHSGRKIIMQLIRWVLRLYPLAWRERYEAEMVALLEQHQITLWTVLDLLVGVLDARLDPYYRQAHQVLPLRRFKSSWRLFVASFVAFWFALLPWFWMSQIGLDDADCSTWGANYSLCVMRKTVGAQQSFPALLVALILLFLPILLLLFIAMLVVARGRSARSHVQVAQAVTGGMLVLCIGCGFWLAGSWQLLPQISQFYPQTPAGLVIGMVGMGLATVLALGALARASFALGDLEHSTPSQEVPLAGTAGLSSSHSNLQQDDRSMEAKSAGESEGKRQEMPMVVRAAPGVREEPAPSFAEAFGTRKGAKGEWPRLLGLVLLFLVPWPALISGNPPDPPTLLFNWTLAVVVGLITAWLVKGPGKQGEQRARREPRRATSSLWWAAVLPAPALTPFLFYLGHGPQGLLLLLLAGIASGATAVIVKLRMGYPRSKSRLGLSLGVLVLATIFTALGVSHAAFFSQQTMLFFITLVSIIPAFFVSVPGRSEPLEGVSSQQDTRADTAPKVVGWVILLLACNAVYAEVSSDLFLNQGQYPLPPWIGGHEMTMGIVMAICLIPALVVKIQTSNRWAAGVREPVPNGISPKVWMLVLPLLFLTCVTQLANLSGPDFSSFADVFSIWLLTGMAALILLLAFRLGSRASTMPPNQELPQPIYEQG